MRAPSLHATWLDSVHARSAAFLGRHSLVLECALDTLQARKVANAIEDSQRLARLDDQAGGSMVTGVSFATMDNDDENDSLQFLNVILKVPPFPQHPLSKVSSPPQ
jgi:hypothetical protein